MDSVAEQDGASATEAEIRSQPNTWRQAAALAASAEVLPDGLRIAIVGCGTSYNVAVIAAVLRERRGRGETDAFVASETPRGRRYDRVVVISRSGTTTEVLWALERLAPDAERIGILGVPRSPIGEAVHRVVLLDFADEASIVQTRFPTTAAMLLRAELGDDVARIASSAEAVLAAPLPFDPGAFDHFVFLGRGWATGVAAEAALKLQETAAAHSEAHPAMEYRHGPIATAGPGTAVWLLGEEVPGLAEDVATTGATVVSGPADPLVELVQAQRAAVALARARNLDPDRPHRLSRSVILRDGA
jgi:fructoselysine-6-P-deglycase FrlB-like protein